VIAYAAGVEHQRKLRIRPVDCRSRLQRDQARAPVGREKAALLEQPRLPHRAVAIEHDRPLHWRQRLIGLCGKPGEPREVEVARCAVGRIGAVVERRQPRVFQEDFVRGRKRERRAVAQPSCEFAQRPPIRPRLAGQRQERALPRDASLRVGDRAVLFAPGGGRQQQIGAGRCVGARDHVRHDHQLAAAQRLAHAVGVRQADHRVGRDDPHRTHAACVDRLEQLHGHQSRPRGDHWAVPEPLHELAMGVVGQVQVRGELIRQAADLAATHRIGLARDRERTCAGLADAAGQQVAVDDRIGLVGPGRGLVDAHRKCGHHPRGAGPPGIELLQNRLVESTDPRHPLGAGGAVAGRTQRLIRAAGVVQHILVVDRVAPCEFAQQAVEQPHIGTGRERQVQVGLLAGRGAAGVDHHHAHAGPALAGGGDALPEHRMTPGGVGADEHDQVGELQVLVGQRDRVAAERALVCGDRRGHAQP
jgi:hypothetical protein